MNRGSLLECWLFSHHTWDLLEAGVGTVPVKRGSCKSGDEAEGRWSGGGGENVRKWNGDDETSMWSLSDVCSDGGGGGGDGENAMRSGVFGDHV